MYAGFLLLAWRFFVIGSTELVVESFPSRFGEGRSTIADIFIKESRGELFSLSLALGCRFSLLLFNFLLVLCRLSKFFVDDGLRHWLPNLSTFHLVLLVQWPHTLWRDEVQLLQINEKVRVLTKEVKGCESQQTQASDSLLPLSPTLSPFFFHVICPFQVPSMVATMRSWGTDLILSHSSSLPASYS